MSKAIPINNILITNPIADAIQGNGGNIVGLDLKKCPGDQGFSLNRMPKVLDAFMMGESLPPIKVRRWRNSNYYVIIDGRHRFSASIIFGCTHILCVEV